MAGKLGRRGPQTQTGGEGSFDTEGAPDTVHNLPLSDCCRKYSGAQL
jgi:hypothetical protein